MAELTFQPTGRERARVTADGRTIAYTYHNQDPQNIPEGMRRVTYLEPDPHYTKDNQTSRLEELETQMAKIIAVWDYPYEDVDDYFNAMRKVMEEIEGGKDE